MEIRGASVADEADGGPNGFEPRFAFAQYRLFPRRRTLLSGDQEIRLRGREFDVLLTLLEHAGEFLSNDELIARVWPTSTVSESNLRVQVASLRRALGDNGVAGRMIINVTGRGYSFAIPVSRDQFTPAPAPSDSPPAPAGPDDRPANLPVRLTGLIGRDSNLARLQVHMRHRRIVTVVGPGGIGKTSLALALAEQSVRDFEDGIYFADLAAISDPANLPSAVALALNLRLDLRDRTPALLQWLSDRRVLLIFDNCEHIIEAAAAFVETLLQGAPNIRILCTSRESLRVEDEWIHRLAPLDVPPPSDTLVTAEAMAYSAIELFVERASACRDLFVMNDDEAPLVAEICRRLDGIPLAIELAAARVDQMTVRALAARLTENLQILARGKRTAKPHQQTLLATLDWSYGLLNERERTTLNRLSVFCNGFTVEAAIAVAGDAGISALDLTDTLFELIGKSLVFVEPTEDSEYYRLLETTRKYAGDKLAESGEAQQVAASHAAFCLQLLRQAQQSWTAGHQASWTAEHGRWIDDVSAAIDWAYAPGGDVELGIELAAMSAPLASRLALLQEYVQRVSSAMDKLRELSEPNPKLEFALAWELSYLLQFTSGNTPELRSFIDRVHLLQDKVPSVEYQLDILHFDFGLRFSKADWAGAFDTGQQLLDFADRAGSAKYVTIGERMRSQAHHYLGQHPQALAAARRALAGTASPQSAGDMIGRVDIRVSARITLARSLWLVGEPDNALEVMHECLAVAEASRNNTLCQALALGAVPLSVWRGEKEAAAGFTKAIMEVAAESGMDYWTGWGKAIRAAMGKAPKFLPEFGDETLTLDELYTYSRHLIDDEAIARVASGAIPWCAPEVMRGHALNGYDRGTVPKEGTRAHLLDAIALAEAQGAVGWVLRIALDLARLAEGEDERGTALLRLQRTLARVQGGAATGDVLAAQAMLASA